MENNTFIGFLPLIMLFGIVAIMAIPYWRICSRTGLSMGLVAILFIPGVGWFVLLWIVAFSKWPNVSLPTASVQQP
jgi:hypothetical protein